MVSALISNLGQFVVIVGIVYLCYLIFNRKKEGFFNWIGLYKPKDKKWIKWTVITFVVAVIIMVGPIIIFKELGVISKDMMTSKELAGRGFTLSTIIIVLSKAIFQTALSEEILFRGFIGKGIARKFGYKAGNIIQALLFSLPHGLPFMIVYKSYAFGLVLMISAGIVGFMQFYINEKKADGSILPSFLNHSVMNIISFLSQAF